MRISVIQSRNAKGGTTLKAVDATSGELIDGVADIALVRGDGQDGDTIATIAVRVAPPPDETAMRLLAAIAKHARENPHPRLEDTADLWERVMGVTPQEHPTEWGFEEPTGPMERREDGTSREGTG